MDSFIGYVYVSAFNFAPVNFAYCSGQLEPITNNQALFSLLGTKYGGDGRTTYGLPDLRARVPVGSNVMGSAPAFQDIPWGANVGRQDVSLTTAHMPVHNHQATASSSGGGAAAQVQATTDLGDSATPSDGAYLAQSKATGGPQDDPEFIYKTSPSSGSTVPLGGVSGGGAGDITVTVEDTGGGASFSIQNPCTGMAYVICTYGLYPSRN